MDDLRHTVLCVDDEQNILNALKRLLRKESYRLLTSTTGSRGLQLLAENDVQVVISDQRMPEMNGTVFLKQVKEMYPHIIRIILTGYTDVDTISNSINQGHIYKFFLKPWNDHQLILEIRQALEQYDLMQTNIRLNEMTAAQNEELRTINDDLERMVAERTESLEMQNQALQLSHVILEDLPFPIVGISNDKMIALVNKIAQRHFCENQPLLVGEYISDYIQGLTDTLFQDLLASSRPRHLACQGKHSGRSYELDFHPLTGRFSNNGLIITLRDAVPANPRNHLARLVQK